LKRLLALLVTAFALLSGCTSGIHRPVHEVTASVGADQVQHVRITTHSFYFDPNRIVVKRGIPVELTVHNGAFMVPHNFTCREPQVGLDLKASAGMFHGTKTIRFTPEKAGEYPFICGVDGHAGKGMTGTLVVVEP
jgi:plastocyanin